MRRPFRLLSSSMRLDRQDFVDRYAKMSEAELLELARSYDTLTESAQALLRAEFGRRSLEPPMVEEDDRQAVSRDLVTIRRYRDLSEAIVARSFLESAGIAAFLCDESIVRLEWQISNFIGGIRLQVEAAHREAALELLAQPIQNPISFGNQADFSQPNCPRCGSMDITFKGSSRGPALASLYLLSLPLPLGRKTWQCNSCDARWEDTEKDAADETSSPLP